MFSYLYFVQLRKKRNLLSRMLFSTFGVVMKIHLSYDHGQTSGQTNKAMRQSVIQMRGGMSHPYFPIVPYTVCLTAVFN